MARTRRMTDDDVDEKGAPKALGDYPEGAGPEFSRDAEHSTYEPATVGIGTVQTLGQPTEVTPAKATDAAS